MSERWWWQIGRFARPHVGTLVAVVALILIQVSFEALEPWPLKLVVDHVLAGVPLPEGAAWLLHLPGAASATGQLAWLTAGTIVLFLAAWGFRLAQAYLSTGVGTRMTYGLGAALFDHIQRLSLSVHARRGTGDLVQRVTSDAGCARELVVGVGVTLVTSLITLGVTLGVMWRLDPWLTLVAMAAVPLLAVAMKRFSQPMEDRSYEQMELQGSMMGFAEQTLAALPLVQAFGREPLADAQFTALARRSGSAYIRLTLAQLAFTVSTTAVTAAGTAAIMLFGGWKVATGEMTVGTLLVFLTYLTALYNPVESMAYLSMGFASAAGGARRVLQILNTHDMVEDRPGAHDVLGRAAGLPLRFDEVSFGYEPDRLVVRDVSCAVAPGETLAIVGPTGSGKSTLAMLMLRLAEPTAGRITLGGDDLRDLRIASLRAQFAVVMQESLLFPVSVADNIAYARPDATRDDVVRAARAAQAHDFITALPGGYDTVIGERGATLSGGQRQRLAIARAFLKDAPILILDEPTSALDAATESSLVEALERLMEGRTTIIIAHRLSTIRRADRILVIDRGAVVEDGPHEALLARGQLYARLYRAQVEGHAEPMETSE